MIIKYSNLNIQAIFGRYNSNGPLVARLLESNKEFCFPSGESLFSFWTRVNNGLIKTLGQFRGQKNRKIALVGHGGSFTIIMLSLLGYSFYDEYFPIFIFRMGDSTIIRIRNKKIHFLSHNSFYLPDD